MKFPAMNKRPRQAVVVPELSGGLNLRDSVSMINDNQLTDCKNVWFKDGVLKTRPGISDIYLIQKENPQGEMRPHDVYIDTGGEKCRLFSLYKSSTKVVNFYLIGKTWYESLPEIFSSGNYFVSEKDNILYYYCSEGVFKYDFSKERIWDSINELQMYIPLLMINCKYKDNQLIGDMYETFNLISSRYKIQYKFETDCNTRLEFVLPYECEPDDVVFELEYDAYLEYADEPKVYHYAGEYNPEKPTRDKLILVPRDDKKTFFLVPLDEYADPKITYSPGAPIIDRRVYDFDVDGNNNWVQNTSAGRLHTVTITAITYDRADEKNSYKNKVFNMSRCIWFGGDGAGINGGTRLFLGGNTAEPNLVVWSDLNNPLYFPENNYFYVGESSSAVTAFGKQSDMLVIFKENETYFTKYNRNSSISADDIINQTVIDYIGSSVYFPLFLINANIGCDCPDTIQLCRNRLVWTNSSGKVYTLVSNNQYSERNIFEIGKMVERKLREQTNLIRAHSSDWNGYYILQSGSSAYVLDYNSYGYQYVSSYSKSEDANLRIPWYYWEFALSYGNSTPSIIAAVDGNLKIINSGYNEIFVGEISDVCEMDNTLSGENLAVGFEAIKVPISTSITTKLFEFGAQGYRKNVDKVMLSLGNNGGEPIKVEFITDEGSEEEYVTLEGEDTKAYSPGYVKSVPLNPCIRSVERFGVKLSCEGPLAVDGITLFYRVLGGVK